MVHRLHSIATTEKLMEIPPSATFDFPYIGIDTNLALYPDGYSTWHWHDYFEFGIVTSGTMELTTQRRRLRLSEGEGYFVNANVLHANRMLGENPVRLLVQQFEGKLICGANALSRQYLRTIEGCERLEVIPLSPDDSVQSDILAHLSASFEAAESEAKGFELGIAFHLTGAWQGLFSLAEPQLQNASPRTDSDASRIKLMLSFIHAHYGEPVNVSQIAAAANVGEREAYRCFQKTLGTTPTAYLMQHRTSVAAHLLIATSRTITDIASACGFSSPSYFCKVFHSFMGESPRGFRSKGNSSGGADIA